MKAFLFNSTRDWDERHGACIVSDTKDEAISIYQNEISRDEKVEIQEIEIEIGTVLAPNGFDAVGIEKVR